MKKDKFFEKYKDPRWQKRRLEKMQDAKFSCEICGDETKTLNVHHKYYIQGNNPWEYKNDALAVFCEDCHNKEHKQKEHFEVMLMQIKEYFTFHELTYVLDSVISEYEDSEGDLSMQEEKKRIICGLRSGLLKNMGDSIMNSEFILKAYK